ncbi:MAG TPA: Fic family protein, partial [Thermomicrobiales bacterium]|nr:Fic family protein [Thermomicrobiales bacterium]
GGYKSSSNNVAAFDEDGNQVGIILETATPFDTPRLMAELVAWYRDSSLDVTLHPLLAVGIFVVAFLEIHPFQDGNGRLSRILTTLLLLQTRYAYVPYSSLEHVIEQSKDRYYLALRRTQGTIRSASPDWHPWLIFFVRALHQQMRRLADRIERERLILSPLPPIASRIVEHAREHGRVTIGEMAVLTGVSRNTLKVHLRNLVHDGHIAQHGAGRGTWYSLP